MVAIILAYPKKAALADWSILAAINSAKYPSLRTPSSNIDTIECFVFDDDQQASFAFTALTSWADAHAADATLGCDKINLFKMDPRFSIMDYAKNVPSTLAKSTWAASSPSSVDDPEVAEAMRSMPTRVVVDKQAKRTPTATPVPAVPEAAPAPAAPKEATPAPAGPKEATPAPEAEEAVKSPKPAAAKRAPKALQKFDSAKAYGPFSADTFALIINNTTHFGADMKRTPEFRAAVAAHIANEATELVNALSEFNAADDAEEFADVVAKKHLELQNAIKYTSLVVKAVLPPKAGNKRKRGTEEDDE